MADPRSKQHQHFSKIGRFYRRLRTTDEAPLIFIRRKLAGLSSIKAADLGCGAGRYDLLLFKYLKNLHLTCIDRNKAMLQQASDYLQSRGLTNFKKVLSDANKIPLREKSMDCLFSFNAIHHFDLPSFLQEASKIVKDNGKIFIYTRLTTQNARSIWGQHFPFFLEKETRLYQLDELRQAIDSTRTLDLKSTKYFKYKRTAPLEGLLERIRARHYSTFSLYEPAELAEYTEIFKRNIARKYNDLNSIHWIDENVMLLLKTNK